MKTSETKPVRVTNRDAARYVGWHLPFRNTHDSMRGVRLEDDDTNLVLYVVYSYSTPVYCYDAQLDRAYYTSARHSVTTSKQMSQAMLRHGEEVPQDVLDKIAQYGAVKAVKCELINGGQE